MQKLRVGFFRHYSAKCRLPVIADIGDRDLTRSLAVDHYGPVPITERALPRLFQVRFHPRPKFAPKPADRAGEN